MGGRPNQWLVNDVRLPAKPNGRPATEQAFTELGSKFTIGLSKFS
jgi:hypothetical protein